MICSILVITGILIYSKLCCCWYGTIMRTRVLLKALKVLVGGFVYFCYASINYVRRFNVWSLTILFLRQFLLLNSTILDAVYGCTLWHWKLPLLTVFAYQLRSVLIFLTDDFIPSYVFKTFLWDDGMMLRFYGLRDTSRQHSTLRIRYLRVHRYDWTWLFFFFFF